MATSATTKAPEHKTTLRIDPDLWDWFQGFAERQGRDASKQIRFWMEEARREEERAQARTPRR